MTAPDARRFLVPVEESVTLRETVAYAVDQAAAVATPDAPATVFFVAVASGRSIDPDGPAEVAVDDELLERVGAWAREDLGEDPNRVPVDVETAHLGGDRYLFDPDDYADEILSYAAANGVDRIVLDPEFDPGTSAPMLWPLAVALERGDVPVEEAPVERARQGTVLARAGTAPKYLLVFGATFAFYQLLGSWSPLRPVASLVAFDLITGAAAAAVVSGLLAPVTFGERPDPATFLVQAARVVVYAPYLMWEIAVANLQMAYVVLHPSLPIDPEVVSFRAAVWGDTPVTTLANSITLTPGTLTVDVSDRAFTVHTLTRGAREDLFDGSLERAVRFVFFGRRASRIPSPRERGAGDGRRFPEGDVGAASDPSAGEAGDTADTAEATDAGSGREGER